MLSLFFLSLLIGVGADVYGCPTNVTCIEKETCCQTNTGLWACCPIENGICCDDGFHCCSNGEKCLSNGRCSSSTNEILFSFPLRIEGNELKSVACPDGTTCGDGETCCELSSEHYACCPYPNAVCCDDRVHCCPNNHICDMARGHCKKQIDKFDDVQCPDGETACPNNFTCCQLESGGYGCCPSVDAVCCQDHLHCCPNGRKCDIEHRRCVVQENSIPWLTKTEAFRPLKQSKIILDQEVRNMTQLHLSSKSITDRICPDGSSLCDTGTTCCLTTDRSWGCCPIDQAVCCSDHIHCCPTHYKCDLHIFKCDHDFLDSIPMLKKVPGKKMSSKLTISSKTFSSLSTIECPDGSSCAEETTCCELKNGGYGCCPYSTGSCCSDKMHCCPSGYSCDDSGNRCVRHFNSFNETDRIPSALKLKSHEMKNLIPYSSNEDELCPDGKIRCSLNSTCCPNKATNPISYSCCPYSKGVCCGSDGSVCCPNNYDCNEQQLSCELRDSIILRKILLTDDYNQCGSSSISCSTDQTCCATYGTSNDDYACCPYPNAQCCSDGGHCCPNGSNCDISTGGCL